MVRFSHSRALIALAALISVLGIAWLPDREATIPVWNDGPIPAHEVCAYSTQEQPAHAGNLSIMELQQPWNVGPAPLNTHQQIIQGHFYSTLSMAHPLCNHTGTATATCTMQNIHWGGVQQYMG
jgi:hypothetical protein